MPRATHTTFSRGKRVYIVFRDGTFDVDAFIERTRDCIIFARLGRVKIKMIRSLTIYKEKP